MGSKNYRSTQKFKLLVLNGLTRLMDGFDYAHGNFNSIGPAGLRRE